MIAVGMKRLATSPIPPHDDALRLAQLALRRCQYLTTEMGRIDRSAPEASAMTARSMIETALVGSYLALTSPDAADRLMKKQAGPARRLRSRFLQGDLLGALGLLPDVEFIAAPLDPGLASVKAAPDLAAITTWLDQHPPFAPNDIATLLYEESYGLLSNQVAHPSPQVLERHRDIGKRRGHLTLNPYRLALGLYWNPARFQPTPLVPDATLYHAALSAMAGLCACMARRLGQDPSLFDAAALEAVSVDGYGWSGSPARQAAGGELVRTIGLSRRRADLAGSAMGALTAGDAFRSTTESDQLVAASELLDWARTPALIGAAFAPNAWVRQRLRSWGRGADQTAAALASNSPNEEPQFLLAGLLLVFAGMWPSDTTHFEDTMDRAIAGLDARAFGALRRVLVANPPDWQGLAARLSRRYEAMP